MKALWFLPFTFAAGAEGFALFVPYLILVLAVLHVARAYRRARPVIAALRLADAPAAAVLQRLPAARPAL
jgi:hypothetical protein